MKREKKPLTAKGRRLASKRAGIEARELAWVAQYQRSEAAAHGDPTYHLPTHDELYAIEGARENKKTLARRQAAIEKETGA